MSSKRIRNKKKLITVDEIPPFRERDTRIAETILPDVCSHFSEEILSQLKTGPVVVKIPVPWSSGEERIALPETAVEVTLDQQVAWRFQAGLMGFCELSDLRPQTIIVVVSYADGRMYGNICGA